MVQQAGAGWEPGVGNAESLGKGFGGCSSLGNSLGSGSGGLFGSRHQRVQDGVSNQ